MKMLGSENERLTQELTQAQRDTNALQRDINALQKKVDQTQAACEHANQTVTQLQQTNATLLKFCRTKLQQQTTVVNELEASLRRGIRGSALSQGFRGFITGE